VPASSGVVWYSVTLASAGEIKADTFETNPSETDTVIALYRANGTLVVDNDEAPVGWLSSVYTQVPAGTYFIAVGVYGVGGIGPGFGITGGSHNGEIRLSVFSAVYPLSSPIVKPTTEIVGGVDHNYILSASPYGIDKMLKGRRVYDDELETYVVCLAPVFDGPYSFGTYSVKTTFFITDTEQNLSLNVVAINTLQSYSLNNGEFVNISGRRPTIVIESGLVNGLNNIVFRISGGSDDIFGFKIL
jgi:hypothetical protein